MGPYTTHPEPFAGERPTDGRAAVDIELSPSPDFDEAEQAFMDSLPDDVYVGNPEAEAVDELEPEGGVAVEPDDDPRVPHG